jgi:hypothetical protein
VATRGGLVPPKDSAARSGSDTGSRGARDRVIKNQNHSGTDYRHDNAVEIEARYALGSENAEGVTTDYGAGHSQTRCPG